MEFPDISNPFTHKPQPTPTTGPTFSGEVFSSMAAEAKLNSINRTLTDLYTPLHLQDEHSVSSKLSQIHQRKAALMNAIPRLESQLSQVTSSIADLGSRSTEFQTLVSVLKECQSIEDIDTFLLENHLPVFSLDHPVAEQRVEFIAHEPEAL
ncbi:hypothetical protein GEMRC1_002146 [Eukaryota sp. GEM-RC1]